MTRDMLLGGLVLTREEWNALDESEKLMLMLAVVEPTSERDFATPEACYESYEVIFEKQLAS